MNCFQKNRILVVLCILVVCPVPIIGQDVAKDAVVLSDDRFDQATFGKAPAEGVRQRCKRFLQAHVERVGGCVELSAGQRRELELAGELDIHRYFVAHEKAKRSLVYGPVQPQQLNAALLELNAQAKPLRERYEQGLHGPESLFEKALLNVVDADQMEALKGMRVQQRQNEYLSYIRISLAVIDRRLPMTIHQREAIKQLLLDKTQPPADFGDNYRPIYLVLVRMAEIEEEIRLLFSAEDWAVLEPLFQLGRAISE